MPQPFQTFGTPSSHCRQCALGQHTQWADFGRVNHDSSFERRSLFVGQPGQVGRIGGNQVVGNQVEFPDKSKNPVEILVSSTPLPGIGSGSTTSNALTRSLATIRSRGVALRWRNRVHIPNFALAASGIGEVGRFDGGLGVGAAHFADHDTSACSLTQGRRHSPRAEVRHES